MLQFQAARIVTRLHPPKPTDNVIISNIREFKFCQEVIENQIQCSNTFTLRMSYNEGS